MLFEVFLFATIVFFSQQNCRSRRSLWNFLGFLLIVKRVWVWMQRRLHFMRKKGNRENLNFYLLQFQHKLRVMWNPKPHSKKYCSQSRKFPTEITISCSLLTNFRFLFSMSEVKTDFHHEYFIHTNTGVNSQDGNLRKLPTS